MNFSYLLFIVFYCVTDLFDALEFHLNEKEDIQREKTVKSFAEIFPSSDFHCANLKLLQAFFWIALFLVFLFSSSNVSGLDINEVATGYSIPFAYYFLFLIVEFSVPKIRDFCQRRFPIQHLTILLAFFAFLPCQNKGGSTSFDLFLLYCSAFLLLCKPCSDCSVAILSYVCGVDKNRRRDERHVGKYLGIFERLLGFVLLVAARSNQWDLIGVVTFFGLKTIARTKISIDKNGKATEKDPEYFVLGSFVSAAGMTLVFVLLFFVLPYFSGISLPL